MKSVAMSRPHRQRGSVLVSTAAFLLVCVIALTSAELGYLFFVKREMQKSADLSALSGVRQLSAGGCSGANAEATSQANANLTSLGLAVTVTPGCGRWSAPSAGNVTGFVVGGTTPNAVRVQIAANVDPLLPFLSNRSLYAQAVAITGDPLAAFSVGSRLVRVTGDSVLGSVLKGIGLNLAGTSLVSYDGLANVKITPGGLLGALGIPVGTDLDVGQLNALLAARQVSLGQVLDAAVTLAGQSALTAANVSLLNAISAKLPSVPLNVLLGSSTDTPTGLFAKIVAPDTSANSALTTQVSALDIISTAIGVATSRYAVDAGINTNLLGLVSVTSQVGVVEPPSIAIGGVGAKAYTAQVRTYVRVKTENALLGALLSPLIKLDLPIVIDAVTGKGTITEMCTPALKDASGRDGAVVQVESAVAKVCVGSIAAADLFSKSKVCEENLGNMELLNVLGIVRLPNNRLNVNALQGGGTVTLREGDKATTGNNLDIGTTVNDLVVQLTNLLFGAPGTTPSTAPTSTQINNLATQLFNDTGTVGNPNYTCNANTYACNSLRLAKVKSNIETASANSGLLSGLLNGIGDLLGSVLGLLGGDGCSYRGLLGPLTPAPGGCVSLIGNTLTKASNQSGGGTVSNTLTVLTGLLKPVLNAVGNTVLTPILRDVLGLRLGETDVNMMSLKCGGTARLVY